MSLESDSYLPDDFGKPTPLGERDARGQLNSALDLAGMLSCVDECGRSPLAHAIEREVLQIQMFYDGFNVLDPC